MRRSIWSSIRRADWLAQLDALALAWERTQPIKSYVTVALTLYLGRLLISTHSKLKHTRDEIAQILRDHRPEGIEARNPTSKVIPRGNLVHVGSGHQHAADGCQQTNKLALRLGDISLDFYDIRDAWSGFILLAQVTPDCRKQAGAAHVWLDGVEAAGRALKWKGGTSILALFEPLI
jgi:hypothetical protein